MLFLVADGVLFVLVAPLLVVLAVPAVFWVFREVKRDASPPRWAAAVTLTAAIWLLAAFAGSKLTLFGNYALVPLLIGIPLTLWLAIAAGYSFDWRGLAALALFGPFGSVLMFWSPTREMAGYDIIRNLRPFGMPAPSPHRRKRDRR